MKSKLTLVVAMAAACVAIQLTAMPTEDEAKRAEPVVKKMLAQERAALESGKKTPSEVAAAAMKLAGEADTDAAKLLLMKGAFALYVKDGNLEKAVETMKTLEAAISDMPPQSVTNMIEAVLHGTAQKKDGAQLYKLLDELKKNTAGNEVQKVVTSTKDSATETKRQIFSRMFPGWQTSVEPTIESSHRGQDNVAFVHPPSQGTSAVVSRVLTLSKKKPCLFLTMASFHGGSDFLLSVLVNGKEVLPKRLISTPDYAPWQDFTVPLFAWRGQEVKVEVVVTANGWYYKSASFKRLEIAEGSGRENLIPEAKETVDGYTWSYRVQNGEATIISEKEGKMSCAVSPKPVGSIVIPDILGGAKVTSIGQWALAGCQELESVTIPQGVKRIGSVAFLECKKLKSVEIPSSVIGIGWCAFHRCNALASVNIPSDSDLKGLENGAFADCLALKSISLPDGVTRIARHAFRRCFNLKSLTIPAAASRIGGEAFRYCANLSSVTMLGEKPDTSVPPEYMTHTSDNIFLDCGNLKAIHVPANAKSWAGMKDWHGIPLVFDGAAAANLLPESLSAELEEALVGYWTFDGNANDATKNRNNGTLHGVTQVEDRYGKVNKAYRFNGSSYIEVPHAETLNMTHAITMTAWIKPHNWWNRWIVVMQKGDQRNANYQFAMFRPNQINLHSGVCGECEKLGLELNKWQQVVLTYESGKSLCIYRNGVQVGKWQRSQDLQPNNCSLLIGYDPFVGPEYFIGDMDDVRLFNRALSEKEIKELYKAEAPSQDVVQQVVDGAAEQQQATVDGYTWSYRVENSEATIVAEKGGKFSCAVSPTPTGDISIPATLGGVKVTRIGRDAFAYCAGLKSATIPSSVRNIDSGAFANCGNLQSIVIPEGVESIKSGAFSWYCGVETVSISSTVTNIEQGAFCDCTKLRSFHVDPANPCYRSINGLLCSKDGSYLVAGVNGDVMIPEGVATIGSDSFHGCFGLNSVLIPSSVTNIEHWALSFLPGLSSVRVDAANPAYKSVDGLLLTKDGRKLVRGVNGKVTIPDGVECIIDAAFSCSRVDSLAIPEGVTNIEHAAFYRCSGIQTVTIPSSVKNIGGGAFGRCYDLTSVTMRGERPNVPNNIFDRCGNLKAIHVPANAKSWVGMKDWFGIPLVFDAK